MNKTNYFIECLELMGWKFLGRGIWRKPQGNLCGPFHEDEFQSLTIQELIKRDGVMEESNNLDIDGDSYANIFEELRSLGAKNGDQFDVIKREGK